MSRNNSEISLCMIVKDEEPYLENCLNSVREVVGEIIIVDTGSADGTRELAARLGARVVEAEWEDDFSAARNTGLELASGGWILVLDADEYIDPSTADRFKELTGRTAAPDAYLLPLVNILSAQTGESQTSLVLRLFRNKPELRFKGKIHEQVIVAQESRVEIADRGPNIIHLGCIDSRRADKIKRNLVLLTKQLEANPGNPYLHFYLSTEYILQKDFHKAYLHIKPALSISPDVLLFRSAVIRNAVLCLSELGKTEDAIRILEKEMETFREFPDYYYYLGNIYRLQGDYQKALEYYQTAMGIKNPSLVGCSISGADGYKSRYFMGTCLMALRRYFEAIIVFRTALRENPLFKPALTDLVRCLLAVGSGESALRYLSRELEFSSEELKLPVAQLLYVGGCTRQVKELIGEYQGLGELFEPREHEVRSAPERSLLLGEVALRERDTGRAGYHFKEIAEKSCLYLTGLIFQCICAWKANKPAAKGLLHKIKPNMPAYHIVNRVNSMVGGNRTVSLLTNKGADTKQCLEFGFELLEKLLEFELGPLAQGLSKYLCTIDGSSKWKQALLFRKAGDFKWADCLAGKEPAGKELAGGIEARTELAELFMGRAEELLRKLPVLPPVQCEEPGPDGELP